jgi:hypothetical protein
MKNQKWGRKIILLKKAIREAKKFRAIQRINLGLSRGAIASSLRCIDLTNPISWEFSALSQNGEDGVIDLLISKIQNPNKYFVEIGSSDGIENNTSFLAIAKKFRGVMIEGGKKTSLDCELNIASLCSHLFVKCICEFINRDNIIRILKESAIYNDPDIFSLDIDGNDYYIAKTILENGFNPKIFIVEYNSAFGPEKTQTIEYQADFDYSNDPNGLYYGVSVTGWRKLFDKFGYRFISVDSNGVNAFFVNLKYFDSSFLDNIRGLEFAENAYQSLKFKDGWNYQYSLIQDKEIVNI